MQIALVYDPRHHTFESWACLMCEGYAAQQLSAPNDQTDWKEWAAGLKAIDVFTNDGIPGPQIYDNWYDWAQALVGAVSQPTQR